MTTTPTPQEENSNEDGRADTTKAQCTRHKGTGHEGTRRNHQPTNERIDDSPDFVDVKCGVVESNQPQGTNRGAEGALHKRVTGGDGTFTRSVQCSAQHNTTTNDQPTDKPNERRSRFIHPSIIHFQFIHPSIHPSIRSFVRSFIRSFTHSFLPSFIPLVAGWLTHSPQHAPQNISTNRIMDFTNATMRSYCVMSYKDILPFIVWASRSFVR